jgi:hypothetical protein
VATESIDGHTLAQRYETLRHLVMEPDALSQDLCGAALLRRQGVAAWMRCVGAQCAHAASPSTTTTLTPSCVPGRPPAIEQMLVNIVVAMALVHAKEVFV